MADIVAEPLDVNRDWYTISYDEGAVEGVAIEATFTNQANNDVSVYTGANDGEFIVSLPKGGSVTDEVTIKGSGGGEVTATITLPPSTGEGAADTTPDE
jgi:hypothetical protein